MYLYFCIHSSPQETEVLSITRNHSLCPNPGLAPLLQDGNQKTQINSGKWKREIYSMWQHWRVGQSIQGQPLGPKSVFLGSWSEIKVEVENQGSAHLASPTQGVAKPTPDPAEAGASVIQ